MAISVDLLERLSESAVVFALPSWLFLKREIPDMQHTVVQAVSVLWEKAPEHHFGQRGVSSLP